MDTTYVIPIRGLLTTFFSMLLPPKSSKVPVPRPRGFIPSSHPSKAQYIYREDIDALACGDRAVWTC